MLKILALISCFAAIGHVGEAALCGSTEYFTYTFKPLEVTPTNPAEVDSSKAVCGETHCDLIVALNAKPRCKKNDHSVILRAKENLNAVNNSHFKPRQTEEAVHNEWHLTEARNNPITVEAAQAQRVVSYNITLFILLITSLTVLCNLHSFQLVIKDGSRVTRPPEVCDEDGTLQGRNDKILAFELQSIKRGCNTYDKTFSETDQAHPWRFKYEICCKPINEEETSAAPTSKPYSGSEGSRGRASSRRGPGRGGSGTGSRGPSTRQRGAGRDGGSRITGRRTSSSRGYGGGTDGVSGRSTSYSKTKTGFGSDDRDTGFNPHTTEDPFASDDAFSTDDVDDNSGHGRSTYNMHGSDARDTDALLAKSRALRNRIKNKYGNYKSQVNHGRTADRGLKSSFGGGSSGSRSRMSDIDREFDAMSNRMDREFDNTMGSSRSREYTWSSRGGGSRGGIGGSGTSSFGSGRSGLGGSRSSFGAGRSDGFSSSSGFGRNY